jgi:hypothetical protein
MTTDDGHDPVNRWATEHYGFEDPESDQPEGQTAPQAHEPSPAAQQAAPVPADQPVAAAAPAAGRRTGLLVGGIVSLALVVGLGGVAVAAADDGGRGGPPDGDRGRVVQVDDGGRGDGGAFGRLDGGRR